MRYLIVPLMIILFFAPDAVLAAKDQDDIDNREVVDKDFQNATKEADKHLKKIENAIEDMEKELKIMKKDVQESIKRMKTVASLAKKKKIDLKKINKAWDEVLDDYKRLENAMEEIEDLHGDMGKSFKGYDKAIAKIAK